MLQSIRDLRGYTIHATDGEIGKVDQFLFDDETWTIRYLVVNTGNWLLERLVLISPITLEKTDWDRQTLYVSLTRQQVKDSPDISTDKPVSRQHETDYFRYDGYPAVWSGTSLWGSSMYPPEGYAEAAVTPPHNAMPPQAELEHGDPRLRSTQEVIGYYIQACDEEVGHVEDFIIDDATWAIRYMVIDTRNWWPGKKVLVSPQWIEAVNWAEATVTVDLLRDTIKHGPEYNPSMLNREYEARLHRHYQRPTYWEETPGVGASIQR